tara:strand:+ start:466 stop:693 length:228 start_codon:yes stop_codon:yes gene_type:complete
MKRFGVTMRPVLDFGEAVKKDHKYFDIVGEAESAVVAVEHARHFLADSEEHRRWEMVEVTELSMEVTSTKGAEDV